LRSMPLSPATIWPVRKRGVLNKCINLTPAFGGCRLRDSRYADFVS
jgi:hypothetical protein